MKPNLPVLAFLATLAAPLVATAATVVPVPPFDTIELKGGGHVTLVHGPAQQVQLLKGNTQRTRFHVEPDEPDKLIIDACDSGCWGRYDLEVQIVTPEIHGVAVSGGGAIDANRGFPPASRLSAAVEGGGTIDVRAIAAAKATAAIEGGGDIRVNANNSLTAAINGGGRIRYSGNPRVTEAVNGGGSISKID